MVAYLPIEGGHIKLAERFVDPAFSFTMGWNYWYNWVIVLPAELSAASVLISFWNKAVSPAVWVVMCLIVVVSINMLGAGNAFKTPEEIFSLLINAPRCIWRGRIHFCVSYHVPRRMELNFRSQLHQGHYHHGSYHPGHHPGSRG